MNYMQAVAYLYGLGESRIRLRLENVKELLSMLGNPEEELDFVHVAGTNGKGSVCAMVSSILQKEGYRTGLFISPHLNRFEERISINGAAIGEEEVIGLVERIRPLAEEMEKNGSGPTFFEVVTAMALLHFMESKVDVAVLEVGLGGRLDATNVIAPLVSVITNVSMDHQALLGNSVGKIAREKAGIIKEGCPLITGAGGEALGVIEESCVKKGSDLLVVGRDMGYSALNYGPWGQEFCVEGRCRYEGLRVPLLGEHQLCNAALATGVIEAIRGRGLDVKDSSVRGGLRDVRWPGRLEVIGGGPLVVLDGAHNPAGVRALGEGIGSLDYEGVNLVIGISRGKDVKSMVREISPLVDRVVATRFEGNSIEPEDIAREFNGKSVDLKNRIPNAVSYAIDEAGKGDMVLITGSLFTVGEARKFLLGENVC